MSTQTPSRILVYTTLYNVGVDYFNLPYARYTTAINKYYCDLHGYDWKVFNIPEEFPARPKPWLRVWYARKYLQNYDYIMFLDGDAFFVDLNTKLDGLLEYFSDNISFLFARDQKLPNYIFHKDLPNAGVFLIKNSPNAVSLLDAWWDVPESKNWEGKLFYDDNRYLDNTDTLHQHPYEQLALWFVYEEHKTAFKLTKDYRELNGVDGKFVKHLIQVPDPVRERAAKDFFENNVNKNNQ